jgi:hypothetical protein
MLTTPSPFRRCLTSPQAEKADAQKIKRETFSRSKRGRITIDNDDEVNVLRERRAKRQRGPSKEDEVIVLD